jgi:aminopeptidase N
MKTRYVPAAVALAILSGGLVSCGKAPLPVVPGVSIELAERRAATISDLNYRLQFIIPERLDSDLQGKVTISFVLDEQSAPLQLDFRESADKLHSLVSNGEPVGIRFENEHLLIPVENLVRGANQIDIEFTAGSTSLNRNPDYLYTLFVPDRARTAFPLFDQPSLKASYELTLDIPSDWTAMSNSPIAEIVEKDLRAEYRFGKSDLISSYLFSFVAGKFEAITREINGRQLTMLHRETDAEKLARNLDDIFSLHVAALDWLEEYTGIDYPYQKFGFVLIPAFQYGGMEHVGAIQYRADSLLLDKSPSVTQLLGRASLIAHETAHMWFGNLVTMEWFNDVWTKEVFANFMAAKIVNPGFPAVNHDLNFLVRHYPGAYSVDRTSGANPIRQKLPNLNEAGQMYGAIIYNKAPIMMRQLEMMLGENLFRDGMREYLKAYAFGNATWPALIDILDGKTDEDLRAWSEVWVNSAGRPQFAVVPVGELVDNGPQRLLQRDSAGLGRLWPQRFGISYYSGSGAHTTSVTSATAALELDLPAVDATAGRVFNSDGRGYGLFPADPALMFHWDKLNDVEKGSTLINLYENLLENNGIEPREYLAFLSSIPARDQNQLILDLALQQLRNIYWRLLTEDDRRESAPYIEAVLWRAMEQMSDSSKRKFFFLAFANLAISDNQVQKVRDVWSGALKIMDLPLAENDLIEIAQVLAIKLRADSDAIISMQIDRTENPDNVRKLNFIAPSLSADRSVRDSFFASLALEENRRTESWVLDALANLHHPLRVAESEEYILPSLELLQEIQVTGDIFFPKRWLDETLGNYRSATAVNTVKTFLSERPDYNEQLRMKILQSADTLFRANAILSSDQPE